MTERAELLETFLTDSGWGDATRRPLAGDASNRRYERLSHPTLGPAVLMDAPPEKGEDVRPFIHIARDLAGRGLSPPQILAEDRKAGFLLLEDLGDDLFARVLEAAPELENRLYSAAIDTLLHLHTAPPPEGLAPYNPAVMTEMAALAWRWYLPGVAAEDRTSEAGFVSVLKPMLEQYTADCPVMILRDFHAENLLWLPDRAAPANVGLLDFQDAMRGHPAYDLVSLLQDARRDVPEPVEQAMLDRFIAGMNADPEEFRTAYALLGAQRNLRILGVFARLCLRDGKQSYVDLIPRVWGLLLHDLDHPALHSLRDITLAALPEPSPANLQRLKDRCATISDQ